jgi:anti-sigma28 factor (negative regulator of flagellin synthesis)
VNKAIYKRSALALQPQAIAELPCLEDPPHEQSASAVSGMYFRAVRLDQTEATALARGESIFDVAKVEGLRFELDVGIWRADSEHIAHRLVDDAEPLAEADIDDE